MNTDRIQFTLTAKIVLFLSFLCFLLGYLFGTLLLAILGVFLLVFLVYAKQSMKRSIAVFSMERTIIEPLRFVNHPIHVKTVLQNKGGIVYVQARDQIPDDATILQGTHQHHQIMQPGETITLEYQLVFTHRGLHSFDKVTVECSDRWHLFVHALTLSHPSELTVHSDPEEIKKAKRISTRGELEMTLPSLVGVDTVYEMEGIRDYIPGDLLRDIDWKASTRLQKLMSKLYRKKETVETIMLLDCSRSMRRTIGKTSKLEHATVLALQLTKILQSLRHTVGFTAYDEFKTLTSVAPSYHYEKIYEELAQLPSVIPTQQYNVKEHQEIPFGQQEEIRERQRFLSTVFPFLARGRRTITTPTQASGIYEAMRSLFANANSKHVVILTDMETNLQSLFTTVSLAHARKYMIWICAFFSPAYHLTKDQITSDELEKMYLFQASREKLLLKLKKQNIEIIEISPHAEGGAIIETIRRKER